MCYFALGASESLFKTTCLKLLALGVVGRGGGMEVMEANRDADPETLCTCFSRSTYTCIHTQMPSTQPATNVSVLNG